MRGVKAACGESAMFCNTATGLFVVRDRRWRKEYLHTVVNYLDLFK